MGVVERPEYCCTIAGGGVADRTGAVVTVACDKKSGARCWDTGVTDLAVMGVEVTALVGECDLAVIGVGVTALVGECDLSVAQTGV